MNDIHTFLIKERRSGEVRVVFWEILLSHCLWVCSWPTFLSISWKFDQQGVDDFFGTNKTYYQGIVFGRKFCHSSDKYVNSELNKAFTSSSLWCWSAAVMVRTVAARERGLIQSLVSNAKTIIIFVHLWPVEPFLPRSSVGRMSFARSRELVQLYRGFDSRSRHRS